MSSRLILLDVNALIALLWPASEFHVPVRAWFREHASRGWATCPITQCGFVRVLSNPAMSAYGPSLSDALHLLQLNLSHPGHTFWPDDLDLMSAAARTGARLQGHRQITDAYLLGLAMQRKGQLATLDRSLAALLPKDQSEGDSVIDIGRTFRRR
jgi:uncharacterized protein